MVRGSVRRFNNVRVQADKFVFGQSRDHFNKFSRKILGETASLAIKISQDSMKRAPKKVEAAAASGKPFQKYDQKVTTTFKSGKRKGLARTFTRKGLYSAPGSPPRHRTKPGLKAQKWEYRGDDEVVYGPLLFKNSFANRTTDEEHPYIHEVGATVTREIKFPSRKKSRSNLGRPKTRSDFKRIQQSKKKRQLEGNRLPATKIRGRVRYPKRPYMTPAHNKAFGKIMRKVGRISRSV